MTLRQNEIKAWLDTCLPGVDLNELRYIQSDASSRKYLRLTTPEQNYIIMDSPPDPKIADFIQLADILRTHRLSAPQIIAHDLAAGLVLMNDLGTNTYLDELKGGSQERIDSLYLDAVTALIKMQQINPQEISYNLPLMNQSYIADRLNVFKEWYLGKHLQVELTPEITNMIAQLEKLFVQEFSSQAQVFTHVDYHSRNTIPLATNNPGILDFQDAMLGPCTYDLVSLFQDAYLVLPRNQVESWVNIYQDIAIQAGILPPQSEGALLRNFDLVGLHRHIKNLGIFARLHHRDQKSHYLNDIPTLVRYIVETCARYPELNILLEFVKSHILEATPN